MQDAFKEVAKKLTTKISQTEGERHPNERTVTPKMFEKMKTFVSSYMKRKYLHRSKHPAKDVPSEHPGTNEQFQPEQPEQVSPPVDILDQPLLDVPELMDVDADILQSPIAKDEAMPNVQETTQPQVAEIPQPPLVV